MPMSGFFKAKELLLGKGNFKKITVLVTFTSSEHISGLGLIVRYSYGILGIPVTVVASSIKTANSINMLLSDLENCNLKAYRVITPQAMTSDWRAYPVANFRTFGQIGFGYCINTGDEKILFTGNTGSLQQYQGFIDNGTSSIYAEAVTFKNEQHLCIDESLPELIRLSENGVKTYVMGFDNEETILEKIKGTDILLVPLYERT